jgi:hypothetical protein
MPLGLLLGAYKAMQPVCSNGVTTDAWNPITAQAYFWPVDD